MDDKFEELVEEIKRRYNENLAKLSQYIETMYMKDQELMELRNKVNELRKCGIPKWLDLRKFKILWYKDKVYVYKTLNIKIKYVSFDGISVYKLNNEYALGNLKIALRIDPLENTAEHSVALKNGNLFKSFHTSENICAPIPAKIPDNEKLEKVFNTIADALNTVNLNSVYEAPYDIPLEIIKEILEDIKRVAEQNEIDVITCSRCGYIIPNSEVRCVYCSYGQ